jgi:hypothetical protein
MTDVPTSNATDGNATGGNAIGGGEIDPLTRIAIKHGTDKWGPHFYTPVYHELVSRWRDHPIRLLEIGVGGYDLKTVGGASLAMWAEYFPRGQITGIDIAEKRLALDARIKFFRGSQDDPAFLKSVCDARGPFDVIIDDGSHVPKHVVTSFHVLFPALTEGGLYIIEDVQTAFWPSFGGSLLHGGDTMKLARTVIECLNHAELGVVGGSRSLPEFARQIKSFRAYHNLFVIEKGDNGEPSNFAYDLNNPRAIEAAKLIERELERAPTAEGMANLLDLYVTGGNLIKASGLTDKVLSLWDANAAVLMAAYRVAEKTNDTARRLDCLERLVRLEPDNERLKQALEQARAAPAKSGSQAQ